MRQATPRRLLAIAGTAMAVPASVMAISLLLAWAIPGCELGLYGAEGCVLLGVDTTHPLMLGLWGGAAVTAAAAVFVAAPLVVAAGAWHLIRRGGIGRVRCAPTGPSPEALRKE